jgi:hypothetical protein
MQRARWLWLGSVAASAVAAVVACESDLPDPDEGHTITGEVIYDGTAAAALGRPRLQIAAFAEFPPKGPPRASIVLPVPPAGQPVPYTLRNVPEFSYKVVAAIVDLDAPAAMNGPSGGYPNLCAVLFSPAGNVTVLKDGAVSDVDVVVYDGGNDPCFRAARPDGGGADGG